MCDKSHVRISFNRGMFIFNYDVIASCEYLVVLSINYLY